MIKNLSDGRDPNERDDHGRTPLHWAVQENRYSIIAALIRHGADVNAVDNLGFTPLAGAAGQGADMAARQLLQAGASARIANPSGSHATPLQLACAYGHFEMAKTLVELSDVDVNYRDDEGLTALGYAVRSKCENLIKYLKEKGAIL